MKKKNLIHFILIIFILFQSSLIQAQGPGKWSAPSPHPCYSGIRISVVNMGQGSGENDFLWGVKFTNFYNTAVTFKYKLSIGEKITNTYGGDVAPLGRNGDNNKRDTWIDGNDKFTAKLFHNPSDEWFVYIWDVCFDGMRCGGSDECYADCDKNADNPKPNQLCGLSETALPNNTKRVFDSSPLNGIGESSKYSGEYEQWQQEDKDVKFTIGRTDTAIYWKQKEGKAPSVFKVIKPGVYLFDMGKGDMMIRFESDNRLSLWDNGNLVGYFKKGGTVEKENNTTGNSEWKRTDHEDQRYIIAITSDALLISPKGVPKVGIYNKISENLYEYKWTSTKRRKSSIEFLSNTSLVVKHTGGDSKDQQESHVQVPTDEIERKYATTAQAFPKRDIKGEWRYVGVNSFSRLLLNANGEGLSASFGAPGTVERSPLVTLPYKKVHDYFYTYDSDTTKSRIRYYNDTTISVTYQYKNLNTLSFFSRPAEVIPPPIVKKEPEPVTEDNSSSTTCGDLNGEWISVWEYYESGDRRTESYPVTIKTTSGGIIWSRPTHKENCILTKISATSYKCNLGTESNGTYYGILSCKNNSYFFERFRPDGSLIASYTLVRK